MLTKTFIIVDLTDMPDDVQKAVEEGQDGLAWADGCYVKFNSWEGELTDYERIIEGWIENNVPGLKGIRATYDAWHAADSATGPEPPWGPPHPVLLYLNW